MNVRYVVVVHGMGQPRPNETLIPVVDRFAEARSRRRWPPPPSVLTLGGVSGQTGSPWSSFAGIPGRPIPVDAPFLGEPARDDGMLRFVDVHWGDLLDRDYPLVGQSPNQWADAILGRLVRKDAFAEREQRYDERVPPWTLKVLDLLRETIAVTDLVLRVRLTEWREVIFGQYLGDVQLYGEYALARGTAVRRFHDRLAAVERAHALEFGTGPDAPEARYSVIAHSLGTVMAMDALLYAHAAEPIRQATASPRRGLPLPGYATAPGDAPAVDWAARVDSFVTLGSPIDKFLFMWWLNYEYLLHPADWMETTPRSRPILHFNLSEEQDPVGHTVDLAKTAPAFQQVFDTVEDRVYVRYAVPGLAHVHYWEDQDLFNWILAEAVDFVPPAQRKAEPLWFDARIFRRIAFFSYSLIPFATIAACFVTLMLAWRADSWPARAMGAGVFFVTCLLGRKLIDLTLWWRQVLKQKVSVSRWRPAPFDDLLKWSNLSATPTGEPEADVRAREEAAARSWMAVTAALWWLAAAASFGLFTAFWSSASGTERHALLSAAIPRATVIAGTVAASTLIWRFLRRDNSA